MKKPRNKLKEKVEYAWKNYKEAEERGDGKTAIKFLKLLNSIPNFSSVIKEVMEAWKNAKS